MPKTERQRAGNMYTYRWPTKKKRICWSGDDDFHSLELSGKKCRKNLLGALHMLFRGECKTVAAALSKKNPDH